MVNIDIVWLEQRCMNTTDVERKKEVCCVTRKDIFVKY